MRVEVRYPMFRGSHSICGLWFDVEVVGQVEARLRVLRNWTVGAQLYLAMGGFLLIFPKPRFAECALLDGLPLCEIAGVLSSAPLLPDELVGALPGNICLVRGNQRHLMSLQSLPSVDPAVWIDVASIPLCVPLSLKHESKAPKVEQLVKASGSPDSSIRELFGEAILPPSAGREKILKQFGEHKDRSSISRPSLSGVLGLAAIPLTLFGALGLGLVQMLGGNRGGARTAAISGEQFLRKPKSEVTKFRRTWTGLLAQVLTLTRASKLIGFRQAAYLRKTLQMFEDQDLSEALRHAIPLDGQPGVSTPAFGKPRPRSNLSVSGAGVVQSTISVPPEIQALLRDTYRRSFERLDREGKVDEAAFVLAELLKNGSEAVDYLERKGRIKQAAQLADLMYLAPELRIRLWCDQGDIERAVCIARLENAYPTAIQLLEARQSSFATVLRQYWADDLAAQGRLIEAAEALWPIEALREQVLSWLIAAERVDGSIGIRALTRKLALMPESLEQHAHYFYELFDDKSDDSAAQRGYLVDALLSLEHHSYATRRIGAELIRALLHDRVSGANQIDKRTFSKLITLSDAEILSADLPPFDFRSQAPPLSLTQRKGLLNMIVTECGLYQIHDACRLIDGDYLLAMGEAGVVRVDQFGRQKIRFPVPATRLVKARGAQRVLAMVERDRHWRLSKIDLLESKISDWTTEKLRIWSDTYDGTVWSVVVDNRLMAVDTSQERMTALWQVSDFDGWIFSMIEEFGSQTILMGSQGEIQQWRYALPNRRLIQRDSFPVLDQEFRAILATGIGDAPLAISASDSLSEKNLTVRWQGGKSFSTPLPGDIETSSVTTSHGWMMTSSFSESEDELICQFLHLNDGEIKVRLRLAGSKFARMRYDDDHLLIFDDRGRLIDLSVENGSIHRFCLM